jgi:hypothetical protein
MSSRWIETKKRLPKQEQQVLILTGDGIYYIGELAENSNDGSLYWYVEDGYDPFLFDLENITHWQPLVPPTKEGE